jgi:hypothetical protein
MMNARNAPCECGSGKKFKRCCGATGAPPPPILNEEGAPVPKAWKFPALLFVLAAGAGMLVGQLRGSVQDGLSVSLALLVMVLGYLVIRSPPGATGRGGNSNIDYGRTRQRRPGASNRRTRRRDG